MDNFYLRDDVLRCNVLHMTTASQMGKLGAAATNKLLTPQKRSKAAKKGWARRKAKLKGKK